MLPSKSKLSRLFAANRIITVMCQTMKKTKGQENQKQMEKRASCSNKKETNLKAQILPSRNFQLKANHIVNCRNQKYTPKLA